MPAKIRLMRIGAKKRPFYRVVVVDERAKRTGKFIELLGTYNPLTEPKELNLKQDRVDAWLKQGAQPSDGFLRITGKAPQRPPRKPKKEKAGGGAVSEPKPEAATVPSEPEAPVTSEQPTEPATKEATQTEETEQPAPESAQQTPEPAQPAEGSEE